MSALRQSGSVLLPHDRPVVFTGHARMCDAPARGNRGDVARTNGGAERSVIQSGATRDVLLTSLEQDKMPSLASLDQQTYAGLQVMFAQLGAEISNA